jgi:hypothetical protein
VDKSSCVSLGGVVFDVGTALIRRRVDLRHDPFDLSVIEVWHDGVFQRKAEKLYITESAPKPEASPPKTTAKPTHSRLLRVYEEKNKGREKQRHGALAFHNKPQGGQNSD